MTEELFCIIIFKDKSIYKSLKKNFSKIPLINNIINNSKNYPLQIEWTDLCSKIDDVHKKKILHNSNEKIIKFIFDYSSLYQKEEIEIPPPKINFKHRSIKTLIEKTEYPIFEKLINENENSLKIQLDILIKTMYITEILYMKILYRKLAAVIAMKIKDKTPEKIYNVL